MKCTATYIPGRKVLRVTARAGLVVVSQDIGPQVESDYGRAQHEARHLADVKRDVRGEVRWQSRRRT